MISPYFDWLESICQGNDSKYKSIVIMENTWWLREAMGAKKSFLKLKQKMDKYSKLYTQEVYYYQFEEKIIKGLNRIDPTKELEDQMPGLAQKLKLDTKDIDYLEKIYIKYYTIQKIEGFKYKANALQTHIEKILKRIQKHLCPDTVAVLLPLLLSSYLKRQIQRDIKIILQLLAYLKRKRKEDSEMQGGEEQLRVLDLENNDLGLQDESAHIFGDQNVLDILSENYARSKE